MYQFRTGSNGELILQVQDDSVAYDPTTGRQLPRKFRDATIADVPVGNPFTETAKRGSLQFYSSPGFVLG